MLKQRVITALWGIPLVIAAVWFDEPLPWFTILVAVVGLLACLEFYRISGVSKTLPLTVFGLLFTVLFIGYPHCTFASVLPVLLTTAVVLSMIILVVMRKKEGAFSSWAWMMGGILYIGWLLGLLVTLRLDVGRDWLYLVLFTTFGSDTAAYFIGRAFGKRKLAPGISPGKTWEGAAAGVFGGVIIALLFTFSSPWQLPLNYLEAILLGAVISIFGQFGDLAESLYKRSFGVKDSGSIMPGHGGILDRIDSILFAGAVVYGYLVLVRL
jgi:phosphatidate cytidylyltransferase